MLRLSEAGIISVTMEGMLYGQLYTLLVHYWNADYQPTGFSVFMFLLTIWVLLRKRESHRVNYAMIISACSLQVFATIVRRKDTPLHFLRLNSSQEFAVNIVRLWQGFLSIGPSLAGGPEQYFQDISQTTFVFKSVVYNIQTLILDGVLVSRLHFT